MQEPDSGAASFEIQLEGCTSEYEVDRFAERYESYNHDMGTWKLIHRIGMLAAVGIVLMVIYALLFAPPVIRYIPGNLTLVQFIKLNPAFFLIIISLIVMLISRIDLTRLAPEGFLVSNYKIVPPSGFEVGKEHLGFEYLGGDRFRIAIHTLPSDDEPAKI